ncbi:MAG TPA: hypothetical protein VGK90_05090 [Rhizomicrobium sp.]|jgi:hypothetical protein
MRFMTFTISAAALYAGIALSSTAIAAEQTGTLSDCTKLAEQVSQALAGNQQSANYEAAFKEKGYGRDFCTNGLYGQGVVHYQQSLKLLGAEKN